MKHCFVLWVAAMSLFILPACGKEEKQKKDLSASEIKATAFDNTVPGKEGIKNTILGYNQSVIDAYLSDRHIKLIRKYATPMEAQRMFVYINTDRERNYAMAMKLNSISFENISVAEPQGFADTAENWDFHYLDIKTSKPIEPVKEMRYKLRYVLLKEDNKWVVAKIKEREKALIGEYSPPRWSLLDTKTDVK